MKPPRATTRHSPESKPPNETCWAWRASTESAKDVPASCVAATVNSMNSLNWKAKNASPHAADAAAKAAPPDPPTVFWVARAERPPPPHAQAPKTATRADSGKTLAGGPQVALPVLGEERAAGFQGERLLQIRLPPRARGGKCFQNSFLFFPKFTL